MREIVSAAQRLRTVRRASQQFLELWALECLFDRPHLVDRVASDVERAADVAVADPLNHDWSLLYRGSILDD